MGQINPYLYMKQQSNLEQENVKSKHLKYGDIVFIQFLKDNGKKYVITGDGLANVQVVCIPLAKEDEDFITEVENPFDIKYG